MLFLKYKNLRQDSLILDLTSLILKQAILETVLEDSIGPHLPAQEGFQVL